MPDPYMPPHPPKKNLQPTIVRPVPPDPHVLLPAAWNQLLDMAEQFINGNYSAIAYSFRNKGEYEVHLLPPL